MELEKVTKLAYEIHSFSSFSSNYLPENIRDDNPQNQVSRWSSDTNVPTQFITLRLHKPAIVKKILFGKYEKSHVCNLKKFKIFGGLQESNMFQIYEGGLKNDNMAEIFDLKHKMYTEEGEREIPILYVQIVPLLSFGPSFNFSIWYVELRGLENDAYVCDMMRNFNDQREKQAIRLVLKHLRDKGYMNSFKALEKEAKIHLEDNQITELYKCLVEEGNFERSEDIMAKFIEYGDMNEYISNQKYKAHFCQILLSKNDDEKALSRPRNRINAGYACDTESNIVYMFGGHCEEESEDLNDFWQYNVNDDKWTCISENSGISKRSGQKMIFDPVSKQIFMLGRKANRENDTYKSDFYLYDTQTKTWLLICEDTKQMNGPPLIEGHQICLNARERTIYVFGGKLVNKSDEGTNDSISGFFSYTINTNTWNLLCLDINHINAANPEINSIKARINHSMLYDDIRKKIYIMCGQRGKDCNFNDVMIFDTETNVFANTPSQSSHVASSSSSFELMNCEKPSGGLCYTTIDLNKGEIYILIKDNLWMYSLATNEFSTIHKSAVQQTNGKDSSVENYARAGDVNYFVYVNSSLYVFKSDSEYTIQLRKPSRDSVLNYCKYLIRRQQYEEITRKNPISALSFLRNNLSETIDKNDINQINEFHKSASLLFCNKSSINYTDNDAMEEGETSNSENSTQSKMRNQRSILFNKLTSLLPKSKCQPQPNLLNFINV